MATLEENCSLVDLKVAFKLGKKFVVSSKSQETIYYRKPFCWEVFCSFLLTQPLKQVSQETFETTEKSTCSEAPPSRARSRFQSVCVLFYYYT